MLKTIPALLGAKKAPKSDVEELPRWKKDTTIVIHKNLYSNRAKRRANARRKGRGWQRAVTRGFNQPYEKQEG